MTSDLDAQSRAYREAGDADHAPDDINDLILDHGCIPHPPIRSLDEIAWPEDHEDDQWDAGREGSKSLDEARAALAARIADPTCPDGPESVGAYDDMPGLR